MDEQIKNQIEQLLKDNKNFLFMKGTPTAPQCGFSQRAVAVLNELNAPFGSFNVLEDDAVREGIKVYGNWPLIPQFYHNGELIGGSDILLEMSQSGELQKVLDQ